MFCYSNSVHSSVIPPQKKSSHCHCVVAHGVPHQRKHGCRGWDHGDYGGFSNGGWDSVFLAWNWRRFIRLCMGQRRSLSADLVNGLFCISSGWILIIHQAENSLGLSPFGVSHPIPIIDEQPPDVMIAGFNPSRTLGVMGPSSPDRMVWFFTSKPLVFIHPLWLTPGTHIYGSSGRFSTQWWRLLTLSTTCL